MPGAVLLSECAKSPRQWITAFFIVKGIQRSKARSLRQKTSASDAVAQGGIFTLQESNCRCDGALVGVEVVQELIHTGTAIFYCQCERLRMHIG